MGMMYAWATPEYLLDSMTLAQVLLYHEKGVENQERQARIFWGILGQTTKHDKTKNDTKTVSPDMSSDKPDRAAFYRLYGNQIKKG